MSRRKCNACSKEFSCRQSLFVHKKTCGGEVQRENHPSQNEGRVESSNLENKCNDILSMVTHLNIPNFKGSFRCDQLYGKPQNKECGIVYLPDHLVSYYKDNISNYYL